jgi:hypothetical protein
MDTVHDQVSDALGIGGRSAFVSRPKGRQTRPQLLDRASLDGRTSAAKAYDRLRAGIVSDLGGAANVSAVENALVDAFCGAAVTVAALNAKLLLGEPLDLAAHAQAISAMVRVASRLGTSRRARDVTPPDLSAYLAGRAHHGPAEPGDLVETDLGEVDAASLPGDFGSVEVAEEAVEGPFLAHGLSTSLAKAPGHSPAGASAPAGAPRAHPQPPDAPTRLPRYPRPRLHDGTGEAGAGGLGGRNGHAGLGGSNGRNGGGPP